MSQATPSPRTVTIAFTSAIVGSVIGTLVSGSIAGVVPSFFIQACPSNLGYINIGVASTVTQMSAQVGSALNATNSIASLDSGQSLLIKASEWTQHNSNLNLNDFIISATNIADQAVITFFV